MLPRLASLRMPRHRLQVRRDDYVAKKPGWIEDTLMILQKHSSSISTLSALLDHDIEGNCVRKAGSNSRNLLRVKRGLDMVRVLFEHMLASEYV
ncbi:Accelerated cell death 11 [Vitis vinifera]|uniref:Accelerated cell death 11 n=1 Tax=Vitis vinifera TaxID=29760 RepID=A0A438DVQ3_VITVI|nr:Accelerated cell death 11 [Vitis vinifera]